MRGGPPRIALRWRIVLLLLITLVAGTAQVSAMDLTCPGKEGTCPSEVVWLSGDIKRGDAKKLAALFKERGPIVSAVNLYNMRGGDVNEAIAIGRLIHRLRIRTSVGFPIFGSGGSYVPDLSDRVYFPFAAYMDKHSILTVPSVPQDIAFCASACEIVWAGGYQRFGTVFLATHDLKMRPGEGATVDALSDAYLFARRNLARYYAEMGVAPEYMRYTASILPNELEVLDPEQLQHYFGQSSFWNDLWLLGNCQAIYPPWDEVANLTVTPEQVAQLSLCDAQHSARERAEAWRLLFRPSYGLSSGINFTFH